MPSDTSARSRLKHVFVFLKELNELRNPVPRVLSPSDVLRPDAWPEHPCVQVRRGDREEKDDDAEEAEMEPLIRIQRARLTSCPIPPAALEGWLIPGWQSVDAHVDVLESRNFQDENQQTITVAFEDEPDRVSALNLWTEQRTKWAVAERPAIAALQIFERVHALWTMMQREGDRLELMLADGMLEVREFSVRHPILMQRVSLEFDRSLPEFRLNAGTEKVELHRALLRLVPSIDATMIANFDKELEQQPVEPLGGASTDGFFRCLVQAIFKDGEFHENQPHGGTTNQPRVWREPVIFVRSRTAGLSTSLEKIVEHLEEEDTQIPEGLSRIVGVETDVMPKVPTSSGNSSETPRTHVGPEPDILFSKPANAEQYEIAARLAKAKAVLVQGPPGTGKTHTIANLLGHLLSQGKTVLVTAHTTKALRVLRDEVDVAIQPLCLSLLDSDAESQAQLSRAAQHISDRLTSSDASSLRREAGSLRDQRRKLLEEAASLRRQLRDARFSEVDEIVICGEGCSPIEVAKRVKADAERDGWIPGPLPPGILCPLTEVEVRQLYSSQSILTASDEPPLAVSQPVFAELVAPADFRLLAAERAGADSRAQNHRSDLWDATAAAGYTARQLQDLQQRVQQSVAVLSEQQHWLREVLFAGSNGGDIKEAWWDLLGEVEMLVREVGTAYRLIMAHGPELPQERAVDELAAILDEIVTFLDKGGSLGFRTKLTRRAWHQLIETCRVMGRAPNSVDEFRALQAMAKLQASRQRFALRWRLAVENLDGPSFASMGHSPERAVQSYAAEIRARLEWHTTVWEPLIVDLCFAGFRWKEWLVEHPSVPGDHGELARVQRAGSKGLVLIVEGQAALLRQAELSAALSAQRTYLAGFPQSDAASVVLEAQDAWNVENYDEACRDLARLEGLRDTYRIRVALLEKLESKAPAWAAAIAQRQKPHDVLQPPGDSATAWRWRQWFQELERRAAVSMTELQERLKRTEDDLRQLAAHIIEKETWAAQCERTGLKEQLSLNGFVKIQGKITKSRCGVRDAALMREARSLLAAARRAVPVWIMPLSRVFESFDPRETKFDVVIIDEASQSDVTALAALYLAHEHVVVGDKEQVTPDAVGKDVGAVERLIKTNLDSDKDSPHYIPNSGLYDWQTSIYDLAETAFGGVVALREHFRCVPEIIQFCNHLSYGGMLLPLRASTASPQFPAVVIPQRATGCRGDGNTNEIEAVEIVSLVVACLGDPAYRVNESGQPTSIGVISLLGDEQALLIETLLRRRLSFDVFSKHRLLCGNAAQFQGDERDVIFLSMVDGPPDDGPHRLRGDGPRDLYKKRYNVAVSRARNQLWVVHSLDPDNHLQGNDLRRRLILHARDPQALMREMEVKGEQTESPFEKLVLQRLLSAGFRVEPQWKVGAYRIDLVVEGQTQKLAVECDGERWHTSDQLQRDLERQAILERLGWVFVRIRANVFFRDPDRAMAPVFAKLNDLGIEPMGSTIRVSPETAEASVVRIRKSAEIVRQEWRNEAAVSDHENESEMQTPIFRPVVTESCGTCAAANDAAGDLKVGGADTQRTLNEQVAKGVKARRTKNKVLDQHETTDDNRDDHCVKDTDTKHHQLSLFNTDDEPKPSKSAPVARHQKRAMVPTLEQKAG